MKKCLLLLALIPLIGFSQTKNVISTFRVFAKPEKSLELEKAIAAHAQKYHTGDWKWRVFEIQSGPDAGGFHITEGPNSWTTLDTRGNLGAEHTADWAKNVAPLSNGEGEENYSVYREDLSSAQLAEITDKISITHLYPEPGEGHKVEARLKKFKKVWEASGQTVAVYQSHFSGAPQFTLVYRHKNGWKEKETGYYKPIKERWDAIYGEGNYDELLDSSNSVDRSWGEMLILRPELSSK
jgi:hypothetical protein